MTAVSNSEINLLEVREANVLFTYNVFALTGQIQIHIQIQIKVKLATPSRKYHIWNTAHTNTRQIKTQIQYKSNWPHRAANTTSGTLLLRIHTETKSLSIQACLSDIAGYCSWLCRLSALKSKTN